MVVWFTLILVLLGGTVVQSWQLLERMVTQSRDSNEQSVHLSATLQELGERNTDLERSARQYLLVRQEAFRASFDATLNQSVDLIQQLEAYEDIPLRPMLEEWRNATQELATSLKDPGAEPTPLIVQVQFSRLTDLYNRIRQTCQQWTDVHNQRQLTELEGKQMQLKLQFLFALVVSIVVAIILGWWLIRPLRQMEQAITLMGRGYFDDKVSVHGPADMQHLGTRLEWLRQRLASLENDRKTVFRHISQELKMPIVAVREACALFAENTTPENQESILDILRHNADILMKQLEGLTRMTTQVFEARRQQRHSVSLPQFLQLAVDALSEQSQRKNIKIRIEAPGAHVPLDTENVGAILAALLQNAIAFSPQDGEITLSATTDEDKLRLECKDQGAGVTPEDAEHIFDPFYQGTFQTADERQGSGVGLTIVRELTCIMGGNVQYINNGAGACFCVDLPHEN
ncbi:two-component sensor histidine kinase [Betaproteobacteria bacterium]|nr:two-component sensor histidine kinase [Betaproteobacteria bacterium]GHU42729.1 two-component sensor histidine kinase [Betaproteobacteria bacterium]